MQVYDPLSSLKNPSAGADASNYIHMQMCMIESQSGGRNLILSTAVFYMINRPDTRKPFTVQASLVACVIMVFYNYIIIFYVSNKLTN